MEFQRFHKCPACKKLVPYLQSRCDCGRRFTGREEKFKVCPSCGSVVDGEAIRCSCGFLFIFRRFLDKQNVQEITPAQLAVAYEQGRREGTAEEKMKNDAEWDGFFKDAQLKNTVSGGPIRSRKDFQKWKREFAEAKAARAADTLYTVETPDGDLMTMTGEQLKTYTAQQKKPPPSDASAPREHYYFVTKWDAAYESTLNYALKIEDKFKDRLAPQISDVAFYTIFAALCTWAELILRQSRKWSINYIDDLSEKSGVPGIKKLMLSAADTVGFSMDGVEGGRIFEAAAGAIWKLLFLPADVVISQEIASLLLSFSQEYIDEAEQSV